DAASGAKKVDVKRVLASGKNELVTLFSSSCAAPSNPCPASYASTYVIETASLPQGQNSFVFIIYDGSGQSSETPFRLNVDRESPVVTGGGTLGTAGTTTKVGLLADLSLTATDRGGGVGSLEVSYNGADP